MLKTRPTAAVGVFLVICVLLVVGCRRKDTLDSASARSNEPPVASDMLTTKSGISMVRVSAGDFVMGDEHGDDDAKPAHNVHVDAFFIDAFEVTQQSYQEMTGKNPSKRRGVNRPVEQVSWYDAAVFYCNMRSAREGLQPCYDMATGKCDFDANGYRLPTEAEWEYACRAGATTAFSFGDRESELPISAWFKGNSNETTHPVGTTKPNAWGLYDMHGNVMEWCHDYYDAGYYGVSPADNPRGPAVGDECVLRGGGWNSSADQCRCSSRFNETPRFADACFGSDCYGFRCVRKATEPAESSQGVGED